MLFDLSLLPWAPLAFSKPSMPAPPPAPVDPSKSPEAIAAVAQATRDQEIASNNGLQRNMQGGAAMAADEQAKKGAARAKLGY